MFARNLSDIISQSSIGSENAQTLQTVHKPETFHQASVSTKSACNFPDRHPLMNKKEDLDKLIKEDSNKKKEQKRKKLETILKDIEKALSI